MKKYQVGKSLRVVGRCLAVQMLTFVLCVVVYSSAVAQVKFPTRYIDLIVTFAPGGASDSSARSLVPYLSKQLGVPIVVKNIPPPRTGEDIFNRSKPDGYTLGHIAGTGLVSDETFYKVRFRSRKFALIAANARTPGLMFSNARGSIKNFDDLAKLGAKRPIKIGAFSMYSSSTLAAMTALAEKKIPYTFVTGFKGAAPALISLLRGEVDVVGTTFGSGSALYKSGEIKPLLLYQTEPNKQIPDAPTISQVGLSPSAAYLGSVHYAFMAPPGTSKEIRAILAAAHKKAVDDPRYQAQLKKVGFTLDYVPPEKIYEWLDKIFAAFEKAKPLVLKHLKKKR